MGKIWGIWTKSIIYNVMMPRNISWFRNLINYSLHPQQTLVNQIISQFSFHKSVIDHMKSPIFGG